MAGRHNQAQLRTFVAAAVTAFDVALAAFEVVIAAPFVWNVIWAIWGSFARSLLADGDTSVGDDENGIECRGGFCAVFELFQGVFACIIWLVVLLVYIRWRYGLDAFRQWIRQPLAGPGIRFSPLFYQILGVNVLFAVVYFAQVSPSVANFSRKVEMGDANEDPADISFGIDIDWVAAAHLFVFDPIVEELYFRGVLLFVLLRHGAMSTRTAVACSGFIFGGVHVANLLSSAFAEVPMYVGLQCLYGVVVGIAYSCVYLEDRAGRPNSSLVPSIALHMANNTLGAFMPKGALAMGMEGSLMLYTTALVEGLALLLVLLKPLTLRKLEAKAKL